MLTIARISVGPGCEMTKTSKGRNRLSQTKTIQRGPAGSFKEEVTLCPSCGKKGAQAYDPSMGSLYCFKGLPFDGTLVSPDRAALVRCGTPSKQHPNAFWAFLKGGVLLVNSMRHNCAHKSNRPHVSSAAGGTLLGTAPHIQLLRRPVDFHEKKGHLFVLVG